MKVSELNLTKEEILLCCSIINKESDEGHPVATIGNFKYFTVIFLKEMYNKALPNLNKDVPVIISLGKKLDVQPNPMQVPEFFTKINWGLLRNQKTTLLEVIDHLKGDPNYEDLDGILHLIDSMQDYAVDDLGIASHEVFDLEDDSDDE